MCTYETKGTIYYIEQLSLTETDIFPKNYIEREREPQCPFASFTRMVCKSEADTYTDYEDKKVE